MKSDRIFGLVVMLGALAWIVSALQIQTGIFPDPVGPKTFPILVGVIAAICGAVMVFKPDEDPQWPDKSTLLALLLSVIVLIGYAYLLKPLGFLIPTAIAAAIISYQIDPRKRAAVMIGVGLSIGLFLLFKYALGLGLHPFPKAFG